MWVPLSNTPEPLERAKTRVLMRSTDGVEPPIVYSSESDGGKIYGRYFLIIN